MCEPSLEVHQIQGRSQLCPSHAHLLWVSSADASGSPAPSPWLLSFSSVPSAFWDRDSPFTGPDKSKGKRERRSDTQVPMVNLIHPDPRGAGQAKDPQPQVVPIQVRDTQPRPRGPQAQPDPKSYEKGPKHSIPKPRGGVRADFPHQLLREGSCGITGTSPGRDAATRVEDPSHQLPAQEPEPASKGVSAFLRLPGALNQRSSWQRGAILAQKPAQRHPKPGRGR